MTSKAYVSGLALLATVTAASAMALQIGARPVASGTVTIAAVAPQPSARPAPTRIAITASAVAPNGFSMAADTAVIRHDIAVTTVDPTATQKPNAQTGVPNQNLVLAPQSPSSRKQRLALFIMGTNSTETKEQQIVYAGASRGYHAIAIAYPNYDAVAVLCLGAIDTECTAKVREEMLTGVDLSTKVAIKPQDALETRLKNLLVYLNANYPSEGWGSFLTGGAINWSMVSAIGHSQGAGHVAYLAKRHAMFRAVMISGVADKTSAGAVAPWLGRANLTPIANQYGFSHTADATVPIATAEASWNAIGLAALGAPQSTDGQRPDYAGSHELTTSLAPVGGANVHLSMADDDKMPRNADGTPVYATVWNFAAFP